MNLKLYGIAYSCPRNKRNDDCQLLKIDHLSFKEKIEWIDKLSEEKKTLILGQHYFCTNRIKQGNK